MRIGINLLFLVAGRGGGIERHARGLLRGLATVAREHELVLFTNRDCRGTFELAPNMREVASEVPATFRPAKLVWEQLVLPAQTRMLDVLLSPGNLAPAVHACPSAVIIHDVIPYVRPEMFDPVERLALKALFQVAARRSDLIFTVSQSSARDIERLLGGTRIEVVPGAPDGSFRPTERDQLALRRSGVPEQYILYVAAGRKYKNVDGLIRAYAKLRVPHKLVVTGLAGRATPELAQLVSQLGLGDRVVFSGFLDDSLLPLLYSAADVFVYPSYYEGFGLPVLEAMACGTPVIAANRTSLPEAVGDAGLLVDPDDTAGMAALIQRVIDDRQLHAEMSQKGIAHAATFTWEKTAERTLAALTELA